VTIRADGAGFADSSPSSPGSATVGFGFGGGVLVELSTLGKPIGGPPTLPDVGAGDDVVGGGTGRGDDVLGCGAGVVEGLGDGDFVGGGVVAVAGLTTVTDPRIPVVLVPWNRQKYV
jgi:hypothetical protein